MQKSELISKKRYILTGAPGCGKTAIIRALEMKGLCTVGEAATDVIAYEQMQENSEPWLSPNFIDEIIKIQKQRQKQLDHTTTSLQFYDRSPICTYALAIYLGFEPSPVLLKEIDRIKKNQIYESRVFFIENLGFLEPTTARKISFEESLVFEKIHLEIYAKFGYECLKIPPVQVAERMKIILNAIDSGDNMTTIIETERLILRTWKPKDADAYFKINQDPKVIEFLRGPLTLEQAKDFIPTANRHQDKLSYTLWAAELKETGELIGFIGLNYTDFFVEFGAKFTPAVEVGWRLGSQYWGNGYATEGAKASLEYGFNTIGLNEIVSFTAPVNTRSIRVMEKLGLKRDMNGNFEHPKLSADHPLSQQILYRLTKNDFLGR